MAVGVESRLSATVSNFLKSDHITTIYVYVLHKIGSSNQIILAKILGASFTVMAVLLLIIFSVIILCVRHMKRTTKLEKSKDRKSTNELQTIYEEISHDHGLINTECNMAYATVKLN